jgi:hypothetical protein
LRTFGRLAETARCQEQSLVNGHQRLSGCLGYGQVQRVGRGQLERGSAGERRRQGAGGGHEVEPRRAPREPVIEILEHAIGIDRGDRPLACTAQQDRGELGFRRRTHRYRPCAAGTNQVSTFAE